jgi:hypothetical protein
MASLTYVAVTARRAIRYGIYFILLILVGRLILALGLNVYKTVFPPPPPPPTVAFNRLTPLPFPTKENLPQFTYTVETPSGGLPKFPDQRKVYFMPKISASLTSLEDAKKKAAGMGFTSQPQQVTSNIYKFTNPNSNATLEMNIINGVFSISYDLANDPVPLTSQPPTQQLGTAEITAYLAKGGSKPEDLTGDPDQKPTFLKVGAQGLTTVSSLSEANIIRINMWRKDYDELPPKTPDPNYANVWFMLSGDSKADRKVIAAEFHYFPVDEEQVSTYPTKTTQQALEDLKAGRGYIANLKPGSDGKVTIRRIYQAYYDPGEYYEYYQPIFVFEGDPDFVAYVPAVTSEYYPTTQ